MRDVLRCIVCGRVTRRLTPLEAAYVSRAPWNYPTRCGRCTDTMGLDRRERCVVCRHPVSIREGAPVVLVDFEHNLWAHDGCAPREGPMMSETEWVPKEEADAEGLPCVLCSGPEEPRVRETPHWDCLDPNDYDYGPRA